MESLFALAESIKQKNGIDATIASIIGRPALLGHTGEYIASRIFNIELAGAANAKGIDGMFKTQPLEGKTVNIKWYSRDMRMLDITPDYYPDYYLVLTGKENDNANTSKGIHTPWEIHKVYLFDTEKLLQTLGTRQVRIGVATSINKITWEQAEIFPHAINKERLVTDEQRKYLQLFMATADV